MSGIPTTAEKKSTYTEHFPCRIPVWRILQPFPHFCETHNTHSLSAPSGPPACPEASLSELHQPFMSSRGHPWAPAGGSLPEVPSEASSHHRMWRLWWTWSQPLFPSDSPHQKERELGGLAQTVDTEAGTVPASYTTCASAVHPCVSVCSGVPGLRAPL